jgi:hypothetical protein
MLVIVADVAGAFLWLFSPRVIFSVHQPQLAQTRNSNFSYTYWKDSILRAQQGFLALSVFIFVVLL